jgi:hypothetical protein
MEYTEMLEKQVGQLKKANETDYAAYMHALSTANQFRDERDALKAQVEQLREAVSGIFSLIESGQLVRDVSRDADPVWALNTMRFAQVLAKAQQSLAATEPKEKP